MKNFADFRSKNTVFFKSTNNPSEKINFEVAFLQGLVPDYDSVAEIVENDIEEPLPGTMLEAVSPRIFEMIEKADLLIVKGGGNHETMTEEDSIIGKTSYLFQVKCHPYSTIYRVPIGSLVIRNN